MDGHDETVDFFKRLLMTPKTIKGNCYFTRLSS